MSDPPGTDPFEVVETESACVEGQTRSTEGQRAAAEAEDNSAVQWNSGAQRALARVRSESGAHAAVMETFDAGNGFSLEGLQQAGTFLKNLWGRVRAAESAPLPSADSQHPTASESGDPSPLGQPGQPGSGSPTALAPLVPPPGGKNKSVGAVNEGGASDSPEDGLLGGVKNLFGGAFNSGYSGWFVPRGLQPSGYSGHDNHVNDNHGNGNQGNGNQFSDIGDGTPVMPPVPGGKKHSSNSGTSGATTDDTQLPSAAATALPLDGLFTEFIQRTFRGGAVHPQNGAHDTGSNGEVDNGLKVSKPAKSPLPTAGDFVEVATAGTVGAAGTTGTMAPGDDKNRTTYTTSWQNILKTFGFDFTEPQPESGGLSAQPIKKPNSPTPLNNDGAPGTVGGVPGVPGGAPGDQGTTNVVLPLSGKHGEQNKENGEEETTKALKSAFAFGQSTLMTLLGDYTPPSKRQVDPPPSGGSINNTDEIQNAQTRRHETNSNLTPGVASPGKTEVAAVTAQQYEDIKRQLGFFGTFFPTAEELKLPGGGTTVTNGTISLPELKRIVTMGSETLQSGFHASADAVTAGTSGSTSEQQTLALKKIPSIFNVFTNEFVVENGGGTAISEPVKKAGAFILTTANEPFFKDDPNLSNLGQRPALVKQENVNEPAELHRLPLAAALASAVTDTAADLTLNARPLKMVETALLDAGRFQSALLRNSAAETEAIAALKVSTVERLQSSCADVSSDVRVAAPDVRVAASANEKLDNPAPDAPRVLMAGFTSKPIGTEDQTASGALRIPPLGSMLSIAGLARESMDANASLLLGKLSDQGSLNGKLPLGEMIGVGKVSTNIGATDGIGKLPPGIAAADGKLAQSGEFGKTMLAEITRLAQLIEAGKNGSLISAGGRFPGMIDIGKPGENIVIPGLEGRIGRGAVNVSVGVGAEVLGDRGARFVATDIANKGIGIVIASGIETTLAGDRIGLIIGKGERIPFTEVISIRPAGDQSGFTLTISTATGEKVIRGGGKKKDPDEEDAVTDDQSNGGLGYFTTGQDPQNQDPNNPGGSSGTDPQSLAAVSQIDPNSILPGITIVMTGPTDPNANASAAANPTSVAQIVQPPNAQMESTGTQFITPATVALVNTGPESPVAYSTNPQPASLAQTEYVQATSTYQEDTPTPAQQSTPSTAQQIAATAQTQDSPSTQPDTSSIQKPDTPSSTQTVQDPVTAQHVPASIFSVEPMNSVQPSVTTTQDQIATVQPLPTADFTPIGGQPPQAFLQQMLDAVSPDERAPEEQGTQPNQATHWIDPTQFSTHPDPYVATSATSTYETSQIPDCMEMRADLSQEKVPERRIDKDDDDRNSELETLRSWKEKEARRMMDTLLADQATRKDQRLFVEEEVRTRYIVRPGDTLESIAASVLGDSRLALLIFRINRPVIRVTYRDNKQIIVLKPNTILQMPTRTEIEMFRATMSSKKPKKSRQYVSDGGPTTRINYTVRLGDTLRTIATRHASLQDGSLWTLIAEINGLSSAADTSGTPTARIQRGTTLILPSSEEISEFRARQTSAVQNAV